MPSKKPNRKNRQNQNPSPHQEPQKNLIAKIPEIIAVLETDSGVMFPSSTFPVYLGNDQKVLQLLAFLKERPFLITQPILTDNATPFPIGVLGAVTNINETDSELPSFLLSSINRVFVNRVESQNGILVAKHMPFFEISIPQETAEDKAFLDLFAYLQDKFPELFSLILYETLGNEKAEKFFALPWVQDIMRRLRRVRADNIVSVIDGIVNLLNQTTFFDKKSKLPINIYPHSLNILAEPFIMLRLEKMVHLLKTLFIQCSGVRNENVKKGENTSNDILADMQTNAPQKTGREIIQEELSRPREIAPRFPALSQKPIAEQTVKLDTEQQSKLEQIFLKHMQQYIVNQNLLKNRMAKTLIRLHTGMADPSRPIIIGIICGPTGVGKTESVKALAEFLFGDPTAFTRLDCGDFMEPHDHKRITGAPHSYVGYGDETELSQWKLDQFHFKKQMRERYRDAPEKLSRALEMCDQFTEVLKNRASSPSIKDEISDIQEILKQLGWNPGEHPNIILIDEMEKAHANLMKLLLRVLDEGFLRKANGDIINFKNTIITFTTNLNGKRIAQMISGNGDMGFSPAQKAASEKELTNNIYLDTLRAVQKFLLTEVLGRIGKERIIVLHPLREKDLLEILETITLPKLALLLKDKKGIELRVTDAVKRFIVQESYHDEVNRTLGARALAAVVERKIEEKIGNLLELAENGGLLNGDAIVIDAETIIEEKQEKQKISINKIIRSS